MAAMLQLLHPVAVTCGFALDLTLLSATKDSRLDMKLSVKAVSD